MPFTILFSDSRFSESDLQRDLTGSDAILLNPGKNNFHEVDLSAWEQCDAVVLSRIRIDAAAVHHLKRARILVRNGVGFDTVDLKACADAGIPVCNVPDYGTTEVADTAIAMMLTLARGTASLDTALRIDLESNWSHLHNHTARRLNGCCFGVIGLGRIGTAAALRARAFGMSIAFYDPFLPSGMELALGFTRARSLNELLALGDIISIHTPLTEWTRGMIDDSAVAAMKPDSWVINTARGPVCDSRALLAGLKDGRLGAVGLDVLPQEPATINDPLVAAWRANEEWIRGRVLLNPHAGFYSHDSLADLRRKSIATACEYLRDGNLLNCVNSQYLQRRR